MPEKQPSHYDDQGRARMVDVGAKAATARRARARGRLRVSPQTMGAIADGTVPKGNPFEIARVAGITAAKKTADLIPLCHPLRLTFVDVEITPDESEGCIAVTATAAADERTGVEMEALTACTVALLTIYDMLKAIDRGMVIEAVQVIEKTGGQSGDLGSGADR